MKKNASTFLLVFICNLIFAQSKFFMRELDVQVAPREHTLDFLELKLDVTIEPKEGLVKANVTHTFTPLQSKTDIIYLDAKEGITVKSAKIDGEKITFIRDTAGYNFYPTQALVLGKKYSLAIDYEAKPKKGLYFVGWNDTLEVSKKQIWSQGQAIDNRYWIPMYDEMNDKIISEVNVTFNKDYKVLSNGAKLLEKDNLDGTKTWKYRMTFPHSPYLIMLAIGKYEVKELKSKSGVPIRLYYYPEHKERVDAMYKYTDRIMDFFEKEIGVAYPWKTTYSQIPVQDYMFGAMENTTATVFGDFYCVDNRSYLDRNYVGVNAHEMAHMWFGDLITARSSSDSWLQESFATHYQWLFDREVFGQNQFDYNRRLATNESLKASLNDKKAIASVNGGTTRWYPKGAFVIEMIKYVVGREDYNRAIKYYLEKNAYKSVDSNELLLAFQDVLGISLNWFWDEWVYKGGEPHYKVSYQDIKNQKNERTTEITVEQIQETNDFVGLFKMPIKMEVWYRDGSKDSSISLIENKNHKITIPNRNNLDIDFVLFDPNSQVLKSVTFHKYQEELFKQALKAPYMLDRYDALLSIRNVDIEKKRETLISVYLREKFHLTKAEAIAQLINDTALVSKNIVMESITDKDVNVRKNIINSLTSIPLSLEIPLRRLLKDSSYQVVELALEKLSFNFPEKAKEYLEITKDEMGNSGKNIRIKWLEIACLSDKQKYISELISYSNVPYEFRTRINAIEALKRLNYVDDKSLGAFLNAACHFNTRLGAPAEQGIQYFYKQNQYKKLIQDFSMKSSLTITEKAVLKRNMK
jgi:aminopeptidase N